MPPVAEFPLSPGGGNPVGVTEDASGNAWVLLSDSNIAEIGQGGNLLAQYPAPNYRGLACAPTGSALGLITYDATDGKFWFCEANGKAFGTIDPAAGTVLEIPLLPSTNKPGIDQIIAGPDGNIYFAEAALNEIGMLDIKTDLVSQFTMPLADTQPQGITVGADGKLWFSERGQNKIGSLNPTSHVIANPAANRAAGGRLAPDCPDPALGTRADARNGGFCDALR
jgi:virginiamycin B lyase